MSLKTNKYGPFYVALIIVVVLIVAYLLLWYGGNLNSNENNRDNNKNQDQASVTIEDQYDNKIVYTTDTSTDTQALRDDCEQRGGNFNECGSICPPEAEICAEICAYTCEFDDRSENPTNDNFDLELTENYKDQDLAISFDYPSQMELEEGPDSVNIYYWGEDQRRGTELYDGISITLRGIILDDDETVQDKIEEDIGQEELLGELINDMTTTTFAGRIAYNYKVRTLGELDKTWIALDDDNNYDFLEIIYNAPDPNDKGYSNVVEDIISSIEFK